MNEKIFHVVASDGMNTDHFVVLAETEQRALDLVFSRFGRSSRKAIPLDFTAQKVNFIATESLYPDA